MEEEDDFDEDDAYSMGKASHVCVQCPCFGIFHTYSPFRYTPFLSGKCVLDLTDPNTNPTLVASVAGDSASSSLQYREISAGCASWMRMTMAITSTLFKRLAS